MRVPMSKINRPADDLQWAFESGYIPALFGDGKMKLYSAARARQVLLIGSGSLFDNGVMELLSYQPGLSIKHAKYRDDFSILKDVVEHKPDVVVLISSPAMNLDYIVGILMSVQVAHLRLVILSLETIKIEIYEKGSALDEIRSTNVSTLNVDDFLLALYDAGNDPPHALSL